MREWWIHFVQRFRMQRSTELRVTGVQALAPGVAIYAIDVDGRRIIVGASAHAMCVLDRYRAPNHENRAGPSPASGQD